MQQSVAQRLGLGLVQLTLRRSDAGPGNEVDGDHDDAQAVLVDRDDREGKWVATTSRCVPPARCFRKPDRSDACIGRGFGNDADPGDPCRSIARPNLSTRC